MDLEFFDLVALPDRQSGGFQARLDVFDGEVGAGGGQRRDAERDAGCERDDKSLHVVVITGNVYLSNSRTNLDRFKGFLISSSLRSPMHPTSFSARGLDNSGIVSFGFGWWYYAQTEGAPALA